MVMVSLVLMAVLRAAVTVVVVPMRVAVLSGQL